ncbi:MAG: helix-turn-helix domain-containing protein [Coriobacteriia bacterium]
MESPTGIGTALVRARQERGLSQRALGGIVGVKQQQIARWEASDYACASLARVEEVARALGIGSAGAATSLLAAEAPAAYRTDVAPVRDLAEVVTRIRGCSQDLRARFGVRRLGVYGSFVSGEQTPDSDVDILGELDVVDFDNEIGGAVFLQRVLGRRVDFTLASELHPSIRQRVLGEVLYVWEAR